jgi:hypothetical protein
MQSTDARYRARWFEKSDRDDILRWYVGAAGRTIDIDDWDWQYVKNPAGRGPTPMVVAEEIETREVVGFLLSTPWELRRKDEVFHATIGSDAYVRPEHRNRGVYNKMVEFLLSNAGEALGDIRYSFYNERLRGRSRNSADGFETSVSLFFLNPKKVSNLIFQNQLAKFLAPFVCRSKKPSLSRDEEETLEIRRVDLDPISKLYEKWAETADCLHTHRNLRYLRWRFQENPKGHNEFLLASTDGEEVGYFVLHGDENFGRHPLTNTVISDYVILKNDPNVFQRCVSRILSDQRDCDVLMARTFATHPYQERLRRLGFMDSAFFPLNLWIKPGFMGIRIYDHRLDDAKSRDAWYLTQSDCF